MCYLCNCEYAAVRHVSEKVPKPYTYTDYFKWHEHELNSTLLFCPLDVHTKIELSSLSHENK